MSAPPRPGAGAPRPYQFPATAAHTLANGLQVVVAPLHRLPAATVLLLVPAGGEAEAADHAGLAALTAPALLEGSRHRDTNALAAAFEQLGGEAFSSVEWTHADCGTTVLSRRLDATLGLLAETVIEPALPTEGIGRLRDERQAELLQQQAEPRGLADDQLLASCFDAGDRLSRPLGGDMPRVAACTDAMVRDFHATRYVPHGSVLIVAGDVDVDAVVRRAEATFGGWTGQGTPAPARQERAVPPGRVRVLHRPDAPQSELRVGHASVPRTHPDFHAIAVMNAILGGLFNSRINLNLRERHAYTYGAFSSFDWRREASVFSASTAVQSDVTGPALREILHEIQRIREEPVAADELSLAVDYLTGVFPLRFETTAAIADALAMRIGFGLGASYYDAYRDRIRQVDAAAVQRVAQAHLHPERLQVVVVGDATVVEPALDGLSLGAIERVSAGV
ncbi:MAG: insulinase family protein [Gemmatimonadetes bacterium]|nr:insulinase family protein [Gemmatimonadota bacterium]